MKTDEYIGIAMLIIFAIPVTGWLIITGRKLAKRLWAWGRTTLTTNQIILILIGIAILAGLVLDRRYTVHAAKFSTVMVDQWTGRSWQLANNNGTYYWKQIQ